MGFIAQLTGPLGERSNVSRSVRVGNFFRVIPHLERFLLCTYLICLDSFLFHLLILPIRLFILPFQKMKYKNSCLSSSNVFKRVLIMFITVSVLLQMDASRLYHMIRGQSALKLYVIFNVFEVADKLLGSFGLDVLDRYLDDDYDANEQVIKKQMDEEMLHPIVHFVVACTYTVLHSVVLLYQMLTLNVAVNSFSHALLTLLVSNQFVEIKSAVFKKFDPESLSTLAGADGVERLHLTLYILMIGLRDWTEGSIAWGRLLPPLLSIYASEFVVDWVKHAFITKFNHLPPRLYSQYREELDRELAADGEGKEGGRVNRLARRAGFCALPLCCVLLKTLFSCRPIYAVTILLLALPLKVITSHALITLSNHAPCNHALNKKSD